jgi:hypothetical protein
MTKPGEMFLVLRDREAAGLREPGELPVKGVWYPLRR